MDWVLLKHGGVTQYSSKGKLKQQLFRFFGFSMHGWRVNIDHGTSLLHPGLLKYFLLGSHSHNVQVISFYPVEDLNLNEPRWQRYLVLTARNGFSQKKANLHTCLHGNQPSNLTSRGQGKSLAELSALFFFFSFPHSRLRGRLCPNFTSQTAVRGTGEGSGPRCGGRPSSWCNILATYWLMKIMINNTLMASCLIYPPSARTAVTLHGVICFTNDMLADYALY